MPTIEQSPLSYPSQLPFRTLEEITSGSALIVAPHPDDETLGCGGAIALMRSRHLPVFVLVMSDGTLSHPRSLKYPAPRLRALRESETLTALSSLGVAAAAVTFLRLPDGAIPTSDAPEFSRAVAQCCDVLRMRPPQLIFVPQKSDPHPDHRATWHLIQAALASLNFSPRVIEYPVWDWDPQQRGGVVDTRSLMTWRLDIQTVLSTKLNAIAAYRSQTTNLIDDDPLGFRLTSEMLSNFSRSWEVYLEEV